MASPTRWTCQFSRSVVSDSLRQHARPPCPSPTPGVHPNSCPSSRLLYPRCALLLLLLSRFSHVRLCVTPEMAAHQAPPSLGFSRQEHWSAPGEGNGNPLQYSCLGNPMDTGAWLAIIHGVSIFSREGNGNPLQYSCLENPMDKGAW